MTLSLSAAIKKLLLLFLIFAGLYFARAFLMPLCIGGILATLFLPFCRWMEKKKISRTAAALACLLAVLIIILAFFSLLGFKVSALLDDLASIKQKAAAALAAVQDYIFLHLDISIEDQFRVLKSEQPSYSNIVQLMLGSVSGFLMAFILVLAYFVFLLLYRGHLKNFLLQVTPKAQRHEMDQVLFSASRISQQYLFGMAKMIFLLWIMYSIGFGAIGLENAIFFAVLCGLLEIIPYLGNIIGTGLTVLIAAVNGADAELLTGILITYGTVQLIQTWLFEPLILGPQVKINPLFTIIALVVGELLWGIPGLLLAIPLAAMLKIVCDHSKPLKPYGDLIGERTASGGNTGYQGKIKAQLFKIFK